ncbi:MAG: MaoC family dehydratase N-terminal domain-containing protein [Rhodobacteraceae bacterium]|nr:MaoC family dehydratase N-terminal domain-containing protein [Paracoccaceae bacterium]
MTDATEWIGRQFRREDQILPQRIEQFRATFPGLLGPGEVPPGFHWTLVPDVAPMDGLGRDGHPRLGLFLPDLGLPRRMWAGGSIEFLAPFRPGERVRRESTLTDISRKSGRTGDLAFVTLRHEWSAGGEPRLRERQDIVYRGEATGTAAPPPPADPWPDARAWTLTPDPVLLFRYSALTFNAHRIHYDLPYATGTEGYGGLVVHGPMQAVWMLNLATVALGRLPARFDYRGLSPLICDGSVRVEAQATAEGLGLRVLSAAGVATMQGLAVAEQDGPPGPR